MMALKLDDVQKLTEAEVKQLKSTGNIDLAVYCDWLEWSKAEAVANSSNRKAKEFGLKLSDTGVFCFTGLDVGYAVCIPPNMMAAIIGDKAKEIAAFVAANSDKAKELRKARKASDDYKAAQAKRREEMAASKKTAS